MRGICREHLMEARVRVLRVLPFSDENEGRREV
jgi:hypothetical protein